MYSANNELKTSDDIKHKLLSVINLCKSLNPAENLTTNTKFTQLKHTLGIISSSTTANDENTNATKSVEDIIV